MAREGDDPIGSMGTDTPIAVLSSEAQAALQLLQAELRPGHQPADRSDPRGAGDVAGVDDRPAAQPARPPGRHAQAAGSLPAGPDQRRPGEDPLDRGAARRRLPHRHHRHHLAGRRRRGRPGEGARPHLLRGDRLRAGRPQHPDPVGPRGVGRARADPGAAGHRRRAPSPDPPGPAHPDRPGRRDRRGARGASFLRAWPATAPRRSTPISPSRRWSSSASRTACRRRPTRCRRTTSRRSARAC